MIDATAGLRELQTAINRVVRGKEEIVSHVLTAVLAGGHLLLEDVPGVGKTTLAQAVAQGLGCTFRRVQFTSDLLPSDILGVNVFVQRAERFEFRPGPVFANILLADEINRTTPKTQSSLLEAMNERQVSIDDETRPLPDPFIVIATQNPQEYHGTYPLPESQLDRFMLRLHLGYPDPAVERSILASRRGDAPVQGLTPLLTLEALRCLQGEVDGVRVDDPVLDYVMAVVLATRSAPALDLGVSTRGAISFLRAIRARALLIGRAFALPDDVKALAVPALAHRVQLAGGLQALRSSQDDAALVIEQILDQVPVPL